MYRIIFIPHLGKWVIQIQHKLIFWKTVRNNTKTNTAKFSGRTWHPILAFTNYEAAADHVIEIGLPYVYKNYHQSVTHHVMSGATPEEVKCEHNHLGKIRDEMPTPNVRRFNRLVDEPGMSKVGADVIGHK